MDKFWFQPFHTIRCQTSWYRSTEYSQSMDRCQKIVSSKLVININSNLIKKFKEKLSVHVLDSAFRSDVAQWSDDASQCCKNWQCSLSYRWREKLGKCRHVLDEQRSRFFESNNLEQWTLKNLSTNSHRYISYWFNPPQFFG